MARKLSNRGAGFKAKAASAAFKGDKILARLAQELGAHTTQFSTWKQRLLEAPANSSRDRRRKRLCLLTWIFDSLRFAVAMRTCAS